MVSHGWDAWDKFWIIFFLNPKRHLGNLMTLLHKMFAHTMLDIRLLFKVRSTINANCFCSSSTKNYLLFIALLLHALRLKSKEFKCDIFYFYFLIRKGVHGPLNGQPLALQVHSLYFSASRNGVYLFNVVVFAFISSCRNCAANNGKIVRAPGTCG